MSKFIIPKITNRNTAKFSVDTKEYDYLLGTDDTNVIDDVLDYNSRTKAIEFTDKTNDLEYNGFSFLSKIFNQNQYYINKVLNINSGLASILYAISPEFSLLNSEDSKIKFIDLFVKHLAIEIDERGLFKKLHCGNNHLKKKPLLKILLDNTKYDSYELFKYISIRFSIGIIILEDNTFQIIHEYPDRKCIVLLKREKLYYLLCDKNNDSYLYNLSLCREWISKLKINVFKLNDINSYKVGDLRDIAKKHNIRITDCSKKEQIYDKIKKWLY